MEQLEQGSDDWKSWRREGLGSSDAPIIMGESPWMTPFQLWEIKTGRRVLEDKTNWAQERGNNLEPVARAQYEMLKDLEMPATLVQHKTYPFLRASLDGYNEKEKIILEIKCPGKEDHAEALRGKVPVKYIPQINHQLLVTGADAAHYFSFDGIRGVLVVVEPDIEAIKNLLSLELEFWKLIEFDTPPPLTEKDYQKVKDKSLNDLLKKRKKVSAKMGALEEEEATLRKDILSKVDHPRMIGSGVRIQKIERAGAVDYKKIPELVGVELEKYRKDPVVSWRLDEIKKS